MECIFPYLQLNGSGSTIAKLFKTLQGVLDSETKLIPQIEKLVKEDPSGMIFLTGAKNAPNRPPIALASGHQKRSASGHPCR
jgi:hypothetical protein